MRAIKYNALDTETVGGTARIVSTPKKYWYANSFKEIIHPLISDSTSEGPIYFMWNINFDIRAIIKYLPEENLEELAKFNETIYKELYEIFYIEGKVCDIKYLGYEKPKKISFYDIAQFYDYNSLDSQAEKYLGTNKINNPTTKIITGNQAKWCIGKNDNTTMEKYYKDNFDKIGEYCREDANLTMRLAKYMGSKIEQVFNIRLRNYTSKAGISQALSYRKGEYPVNFGEGSVKYNYSQLSFRGGMFDCWRRGFFGKGVTEIDISSAYPDIQKDLPHWGTGNFHKIESEEGIAEDDYYGWLLVGFDCPYIPYDTEQNEMWQEYHDGKLVEVIVPDRKRIFYPTGYRHQVLTLVELKFLKKYGFKYQIENGIVWRDEHKELTNAISKKKIKAPFEWIYEIYPLKAKFKDKFGKKSVEYLLVKIALNGTYGKTVQKVGVHAMQDFRYGSYITSETRVKIISFIIDHNLLNKVILIATDGIYLEGILTFDDLSSGIGSWDISHFDDGIFLGNGIYQLRGENAKLKLRGYGSGKYKFKDYEPIQFSLIDDLRQHRNLDVYAPSHKSMHKRKPNSFKMCLNLKSLTKDDMNVFEYRDKAISAFSDKSKHWPGVETFTDLLDGNFRGIRLTVDEIEDRNYD